MIFKKESCFQLLLSTLINHTAAKSVYDVLRPTFFWTMVLGIMPLNAASKTFQKNKFVLLWSGVASTLCVVFVIIQFCYTSITSTIEKDVIHRTVFLGSHLASIVYTVVMLSSGYSLNNKVKPKSLKLSQILS